MVERLKKCQSLPNKKHQYLSNLYSVWLPCDSWLSAFLGTTPPRPPLCSLSPAALVVDLLLLITLAANLSTSTFGRTSCSPYQILLRTIFREQREVIFRPPSLQQCSAVHSPISKHVVWVRNHGADMICCSRITELRNPIAGKTPSSLKTPASQWSSQ